MNINMNKNNIMCLIKLSICFAVSYFVIHTVTKYFFSYPETILYGIWFIILLVGAIIRTMFKTILEMDNLNEKHIRIIEIVYNVYNYMYLITFIIVGISISILSVFIGMHQLIIIGIIFVIDGIYDLYKYIKRVP